MQGDVDSDGSNTSDGVSNGSSDDGVQYITTQTNTTYLSFIYILGLNLYNNCVI